jgi:hypothetical protein
MGEVIWKYPLASYYRNELILPKCSEILTVQLQEGIPTLWVRLDPDDFIEKAFIIEGVVTGGNVPVHGKYIGTVLLSEDTYILHFFVSRKER